MGQYVNPGNESFRSAVNSKIYVDKTGLLEYTNSVLDTEQRYLCVSRPRRFGKSMAAGMLVSYYGRNCDSTDLFAGLNISSTSDFKEHINKYDVIRIDVNYFRRNHNGDNNVTELLQKEVIEELSGIYPDFVRGDENWLPKVLAVINSATSMKFVVVIDEWDAIFRECPENFDEQEKYIELLRGLFKGELSKDFIKLAYITGILPIKKYGKESALNNFDEFTMTNPNRLSEYVGFTEQEVESLCVQYGMDYDEMKRWYDGYSFRRVKHIYNPNSVVKAVLNEEYDCYWSKTETFESLKKYICMNYEGLRDDVIALLSDGRRKVNTETFENDMTSFNSKDDVLTVLIHLGYLAFDRERQEVHIPNAEVRTSFANAILRSDWTNVINILNQSEKLLEATLHQDADAVANGIEYVHSENTSILNYNDENSLSCVISLAYYSAVNEYILEREHPAGKGYADIVFRPRKYSDKPAMIVELKYNDTAEGAIAQIKEKNYVNALKGYDGAVLLVGVNYDKKSKIHTCIIEKYRL